MYKYLLATLVLAVIGFAVFLGFKVHHYANETVPNSYAMEWVGFLMVHHLEENDGAWPSGWEDLRDDYDAQFVKGGAVWTFQELQDRTVVDWDADPGELVKAELRGDAPPFYVVTVRNGRYTHWGYDPNEMILECLQDLERDGRELSVE